MSILDIQIAVARADLILTTAWHYIRYAMGAAAIAALVGAIIKTKRRLTRL